MWTAGWITGCATWKRPKSSFTAGRTGRTDPERRVRQHRARTRHRGGDGKSKAATSPRCAKRTASSGSTSERFATGRAAPPTILKLPLLPHRTDLQRTGDGLADGNQARGALSIWWTNFTTGVVDSIRRHFATGAVSGRKLKFEFQRTVSRLQRCSRTSTWNDRTCHKSLVSVEPTMMTTPGDPSNPRLVPLGNTWTTRSATYDLVRSNPAATYLLRPDPEKTLVPCNDPRQPRNRKHRIPADAWWQPDFWTTHVHPDDRAVALALQQQLHIKDRMRARIPLPPPRRPRYPIHDRLSAQRDETGAIRLILGIYRDVSAHRNASGC